MDVTEIKIEKLSKSYGSKIVLDGISLKIQSGTIHCILGLSGSGKTTLLSILAGLLPFDSGSIEFNGIDMSEIPEDKIRVEKVGIIFQQFQMFDHMTVIENILAAVSDEQDIQEVKEYALQLLDDMGMLDHINKQPDQLSGGQLQRVGIARALINNPDLIIADEPSGSLDKTNSDQILELLRYITKQGKAVILSTHDIEIAKIADEVSILKSGQLFHVDKGILDSPNGITMLYETN